ncbi:MAG: hypothetical protein JSS75_09535 [Bacteroidetes bacterium]|nr:hypothetical protein [Bacteroidota bacterium]
MLTRYMRFLCIVCVALVSFGTIVRAQIPRQIAYQGILLQSDGTTVPDGNHTLTLSIYSTATGGATLFTETQNVVVVKGIFNVLLGSAIPLPASLAFDHAYFLGVAVDGTTELTPRTAFMPAPYALNSEHANRADVSMHSGSTDSLYLPFSGVGANGTNPVLQVSNSGSGGSTIVGLGGGGSTIGVMTGSAIWGSGGAGYFGVAGYSDGGSDAYAGVLARGGGFTSGLQAISENGVGVAAMSGAGIAGAFRIINPINTANALEVSTVGIGEAVRATASANGVSAIHGISQDTAGMSTGVFGETQSKSNGTGASAGASGVVGLVSREGPGGYSAGVRGVNNGTGGLGIGVIGYQAGSGWGVYGETPKGYGVYGIATDANAATVGVRGEVYSPNGIGVAARYSGSGLGVALQIGNGAIQLSGTNKAAFVHTATAANKLSANGTDVDNAMCNGDPNCFLFVTQKLNPSNITYNNSPIGVYYNTTRSKWEIFNENNVAIPDNAQFNVLVIKQ